MGLLDYGFEDPNTAGLLSLGLRLMSTPGKFGTALGQAGLGAMGDMQRARAQQQDRQQAAQRQQLFELQMKQAQQAQADAELARANEVRFRGMIPDPSAQAAQAALAGGGGPTLANAQQIRPVDPQQQMLFNAMSTGQIRPMEYLSATAKDDAPVKLGEGETLYSGKASGYQPLARGTPKAGNTPAAVQEYQFAVNQGYKGSFQQFEVEKRRAGAASVSVNTDSLGLKPKDKFEMEQKLGADYSAATKTDAGIVSTAQDIRNILQQGGALKDQAAIYKFAKALDPDGAVREADYAAIVKTAGGLDYVQALFNKALTGEQLSPKQRTEMTSLTNAMANVAQQRMAKAQTRFTTNAKLYNLNPENVFQAPSNDNWSIVK